MRAFMSDLEARYVRRMGEAEVPASFGVFLPAEAEAEARRILAEAEPAGKHVWQGSIHTALCAQAYKILAEALATVVDMSTEALPGYLARCKEEA